MLAHLVRSGRNTERSADASMELSRVPADEARKQWIAEVQILITLDDSHCGLCLDHSVPHRITHQVGRRVTSELTHRRSPVALDGLQAHAKHHADRFVRRR